MMRPALMKTGAAWLLMAVIALFGSACYRLEAPPKLDQAVNIIITGNQARLVRIQPYLHAAVGAALERRFGWRISPTGSATLQLEISLEEIRATTDDRRGVPNRWRVSTVGNALLNTNRGNLLSGFRGDGYAADLNTEDDALRAAANNAADNLVAWLEAAAQSWK